MTMPVLAVHQLTAGYQNSLILNDLNFYVNNNEILGIIGPNGSGKTTLLRVLTGILKPEKGQIYYQQQPLTALRQKTLARKFAVVSQTVETSYLTVEDFVLLGRIPHFQHFQFFENPHDRLIAEKYLQLTDTDRLKDKPMHQLSGGEKQLVLIARALTQEPELLFLDEPTAFLDLTHQVTVLDLICKLKKELGLTVIIILHDLNLASEYCDRLLLLNRGELFTSGLPETVLTYQNIETVYRTLVVVENSPFSGRPHIFFISETARHRQM